MTEDQVTFDHSQYFFRISRANVNECRVKLALMCTGEEMKDKRYKQRNFTRLMLHYS